METSTEDSKKSPLDSLPRDSFCYHLESEISNQNK